jgi:hypothetical protein
MTGFEMYTRNKQDARGMEMKGMGLVALHTIVLLLHHYHDESLGMIDCSMRESCVFLKLERGCRMLH